MKFLLHEMSWKEAKEHLAKRDVVILPVGSNEQHGPHNPLGTDHMIAKAIAEETAKRTRVLCLQVIPFGVSAHHRQFWGTIFISPEAFKNYVKEICLALNYYGVQKIVIVNGHGGNKPALMELARELRREGIFASIFQWWEAAGKLLPHLFTAEERKHAGAEETSVNLALHPQLVDMERAVDEAISLQPKRKDGISIPLDTVDLAGSGVFGTAATASAEKGGEILETVVSELAKYVAQLQSARVDDLAAKPKT